MTMNRPNVGILLHIIGIAFITVLYATTVRAGDIRGWIDEPEPNEIYTGIATIRGWAISTAGVKRIEMFYDGEYRTDIPIGGSRKDVGAIFPDYPDSDKSGFSMAYGYSNDNGPHVVTIKVTDNDGDQKEISSAFTTTGFDSGFIPDPSDVDLWTISDFTINSRNSFTLGGVDFRGDKQDIKLDWLTPRQNFTITSILPSDEGEDPSLDGTYTLTRLTIYFEDGEIVDTEQDNVSASGTMIVKNSDTFSSITLKVDGETFQIDSEETILKDLGYVITVTDGAEIEDVVMLQIGNRVITLSYDYNDPGDEEDEVTVLQWQEVADSAATGATIQQISQRHNNNSSIHVYTSLKEVINKLRSDYSSE